MGKTRVTRTGIFDGLMDKRPMPVLPRKIKDSDLMDAKPWKGLPKGSKPGDFIKPAKGK